MSLNGSSDGGGSASTDVDDAVGSFAAGAGSFDCSSASATWQNNIEATRRIRRIVNVLMPARNCSGHAERTAASGGTFLDSPRSTVPTLAFPEARTFVLSRQVVGGRSSQNFAHHLCCAPTRARRQTPPVPCSDESE